MILGDMGADVIRVEPPGGSAARASWPRIDGAPASEASLPFQAFNRNKRSIVLDPADGADRATLVDLVKGSDFVVESGMPRTLAPYGLDFAALKEANPRIVHVMLSSFGSTGPAADRPANDLTLSALGGQAGIQGPADKAPTRITVPQIWRHAGAEGAAAALIGHARMNATGDGQFVDVSAQCASTWTMMNAMDSYAIDGTNFERMGSTVQMGTISIDPVFPCQDGFVVAVPSSDSAAGLLGHLIGEGIADESWLEEDWSTYMMRMLQGEVPKISPEIIAPAIAEFFSRKNKADLFQIGLECDVTLAPVNDVSDLLNLDQLKAREAFPLVKLPGGSEVKAPGRFALATETPLVLDLPAPKLDEHATEIRAELAESPRQPAVPTPSASQNGHPFDGVKVLDVTWVIAGPASARYFADHGADVIKVESELRPDGVRRLGPIVEEETGWNGSHFYGEFNAGKRCIQLNLKEPRAIEILRELIQWADVMIENWAPGAMERAGIHYEANRELNPDLIMLSTSLMGQTGPTRQVAGYGYHAGAMAGFYEVTGWPGVAPSGPWLAYTDCIAPHFVAALVTAAIDHRRRTGEGQHIDAAQFEMALQFLAPEIMDFQLSGQIATRLGNRSPYHAPQGIYACAGDDQWCAIAIDSDAEWQTLRARLGDPAWARDAALDTVDGRLAAHDLIDEHLTAWTSSRSPQAVMDELAGAGLKAGAVQRSSDLSTDPQYRHRGFHHFATHPIMGSVPYAGPQFVIPGYDDGPHSYAPLLGEHTEEVLRDVLGMSDDAIKAAADAGALQ